ncbi:hypothetical protein [Brevibacillus fortis]|uniref:hypothetical protein n=1 Tax=Brevibacillus fortis TaxID=2126352 RepID=UPI0038FD34AE
MSQNYLSPYIAKTYFSNGNVLDEQTLTTTLSTACKSIYRNLTNYGTWGLASLSKLPNSGLDFDKMDDEEKIKFNNLPDMIYYGVKSEAAILMRMNSVPRSISESLASKFVQDSGMTVSSANPMVARNYIKSLSSKDWESLRPSSASMSGSDYKSVWKNYLEKAKNKASKR